MCGCKEALPSYPKHEADSPYPPACTIHSTSGRSSSSSSAVRSEEMRRALASVTPRVLLLLVALCLLGVSAV